LGKSFESVFKSKFQCHILKKSWSITPFSGKSNLEERCPMGSYCHLITAAVPIKAITTLYCSVNSGHLEITVAGITVLYYTVNSNMYV
jgi:hypothetical protein